MRFFSLSFSTERKRRKAKSKSFYSFCKSVWKYGVNQKLNFSFKLYLLLSENVMKNAEASKQANKSLLT